MRKSRTGSLAGEALASPSVATVQLPLPLLDVLADTRTAFFGLCLDAGQQVLLAMTEQDRARLCGPKNVPNPDRRAYRGGSVRGEVTLGGRRILVPRVATTVHALLSACLDRVLEDAAGGGSGMAAAGTCRDALDQLAPGSRVSRAMGSAAGQIARKCIGVTPADLHRPCDVDAKKFAKVVDCVLAQSARRAEATIAVTYRDGARCSRRWASMRASQVSALPRTWTFADALSAVLPPNASATCDLYGAGVIPGSDPLGLGRSRLRGEYASRGECLIDDSHELRECRPVSERYA